MKSKTKGKIATIIKTYGREKALSICIESQRTRLVEMIKKKLGPPELVNYSYACKVIEEAPLAAEDKNTVKNYIRAKIYTDVIETAINERMNGRQADIAWDTIRNLMNVEAMAEKYSVTERTIRRARRCFLDAIHSEIALRKEAGIEVSSIWL